MKVIIIEINQQPGGSVMVWFGGGLKENAPTATPREAQYAAAIQKAIGKAIPEIAKEIGAIAAIPLGVPAADRN